MKKLFAGIAAILALVGNVCVAEESSIFIGVGEGYSGTKVKVTSGNSYTYGGLSYEIIAGYKQFFAPNFGLRYYANFDGANTSKKINDESPKVSVMNYGVNIDALLNFVNNNYLSFGVFLGLGLGATTWSGKTIKEIKNGLSQIGKVKTTGFNTALNVGVRTEIAKHHGIELVAKVPLLTTFMLDKEGVKATAQQTYNVGVRYIFGF